MEIAIVGPLEFTLGFQLAGVEELYNPSDDEEMEKILRGLLTQTEVGGVVMDNSDFMSLPARLRLQLPASVTPTVLGTASKEDTTLSESIASAQGVTPLHSASS